MRRAIPIVVPAISAVLFLFAFACQDDSTGGSGIELPEAGGFDVVAPKFDGAVPDVGSDAPGDTFVPPLPVTVNVTSRTGAVANVTVVFHDAMGAVVETKATDASGTAMSAPYPAATPAMATVIFAAANAQHRALVTLTGLVAGDVLPVVEPDDGPIAEYDVALTSQIDAGAGGPNTYNVKVGDCATYEWSGTGTTPVYIDSSCYRGSNAVLVTAFDNTFATVAYASKKNIVTPTDGGTNAVTTDAFVAAQTVSVDVTNAPASVAGSVYVTQIVGLTAFREIVSELPGTGPFTYPLAPATVVDAYNLAVDYPSGTFNDRILGKRLAPATSVAFDANELPPAITDVTPDLTTAPLRPSVTVAGTLTAMKGGIVRFSYYDQQERQTIWTIVVPTTAAATTTVKAPALPATFETILPESDGGGNGWYQFPEVAFADSSLLPDYATFKKVGGLIVPAATNNYVDTRDVVLPQNGTFKVTRWQASPPPQ